MKKNISVQRKKKNEKKEEEEDDDDEEDEEFNKQQTKEIENFFNRILLLIHHIFTSIITTNKKLELITKNELSITKDSKEIKSLSEILYLSIQILSELTENKIIKSKSIQQLIDPKTEILKFIKKILEFVIKNNEMKKRKLSDVGIQIGVRSKIIKILSDCAHENKLMQDEIRELDLIPFVLMFTKIDRLEPLLREWCLFCVKNLTFLNLKNQEFIKEFTSLNATPTEKSIISKIE
jgi:hypothetical protein